MGVGGGGGGGGGELVAGFNCFEQVCFYTLSIFMALCIAHIALLSIVLGAGPELTSSMISIEVLLYKGSQICIV